MASSSFETAVHPMMTLAEKYTDGACKHTIGKKMDRFRPIGRFRKAEIASKMERKAKQKAQTVRRAKQRAAFFEEHVGIVTAMPSKTAEKLAFEQAVSEAVSEFEANYFGCDCGPHNYDWSDYYDNYDHLWVPCDLCYSCLGRLNADGTLKPYTRVVETIRVELPSGHAMCRVVLEPPPFKQKAIEAAAAYAKALHRT